MSLVFQNIDPPVIISLRLKPNPSQLSEKAESKPNHGPESGMCSGTTQATTCVKSTRSPWSARLGSLRWVTDQLPNQIFFYIFFGRLDCVGHSFASVAHFVFFWEILDSNPESCRSKHVCYQLSHLSLKYFPIHQNRPFYFITRLSVYLRFCTLIPLRESSAIENSAIEFSLFRKMFLKVTQSPVAEFNQNVPRYKKAKHTCIWWSCPETSLLFKTVLIPCIWHTHQNDPGIKHDPNLT